LPRLQTLLRDLGQGLSEWLQGDEFQIAEHAVYRHLSIVGHAVPAVCAEKAAREVM